MQQYQFQNKILLTTWKPLVGITRTHQWVLWLTPSVRLAYETFVENYSSVESKRDTKGDDDWDQYSSQNIGIHLSTKIKNTSVCNVE